MNQDSWVLIDDVDRDWEKMLSHMHPRIKRSLQARFGPPDDMGEKIGARTFLLDVQRCFAEPVGRHIREQFYLDFPRNTISVRRIVMTTTQQFISVLRDKTNARLQKVAGLLCTQGCFARAFERASHGFSDAEKGLVVTDFPSDSMEEHMSIDFDFDDENPNVLHATLYKALRLRSVNMMENENETVIHTVTYASLSDPIRDDSSFVWSFMWCSQK